MSTRLPQEVQTQKVKTLPDDLKKLAEELLGAKFGEEVIEDVPRDPFQDNRGRGSTANAGCGDSFCASCYDGIDPCRFDMGQGPDFGARFGGAPSQGIRTTNISLEGCYDILRKLERDIGPSIRKRNVEWRMGRRQFDDLTRDRRSESAIRFGGTPQLFGFPVLLQGTDTYEITLVHYW